MSTRGWLMAYVFVNAVLYSLLMPLWEGFDEPFHFGYVQDLANGQGLPDPRTTRLSKEAGMSLLLAPASPVVQQNLPEITSYGQYFSWPASRRVNIRRSQYEIRPELRWQSSQFLNYEAHQPPLAYFLLAIPERILAGIPLPDRVAILRIMGAVAGSLALMGAGQRLFTQIGIRGPYDKIALFCLFSCQMTWATLAHIGNDWLAVPLAVWTLVAFIQYDVRPTTHGAAIAAVALAAALLTKAYCLAFVPLFIGLCILRKRWRELVVASVIICGLAGPWYARNLLRYGVFTGTQESRAGIGLPEAVNSARNLNWLAVVQSSIHWSLWTGNNTFSTFSAGTLNLLIAAGLAALALWAVSTHTRAEWITFFYCAAFVVALAYAAAASHLYTHGTARGPSGWYAEVLSAPALGLALAGTSRWERLGKWLAALLLLLFGYILAATYAVKLIPLYGGYEGRTSLRAVSLLYANQARALTENLDSVALAPATVIWVLAGMATVLVVVQQVKLLAGLFWRHPHYPANSLPTVPPRRSPSSSPAR